MKTDPLPTGKFEPFGDFSNNKTNDEYLRCSKCGRPLVYIRDGQVIFDNRRMTAPLCKWIVCKGDPREPCNTINYI